ncbi:MAG: TIGR03560 family F420-dependent LLM class oxidoreductase, partial [Chloroflexota bacterium]|nr:TIGR03560 family F420-dependent LLM class oxidoreductase [Chloroflexota bacterium]
LGQRASWPEMLARTRETESLGFDGLFLVDHFFGLKDVSDPTHDAYTMLAALAPHTRNMRLGIMVSGNSYRNPALLLKQAITVDHISGGRVDFGVGAGWLEREHEAYGFPFPSARERVDRFAEALEIWEMLQGRERTTFEGAHYQLLDAPFEPKSLQRPRLPLLIGGSKPRMLRLVARYADIWNTVGSPDDAGILNRHLDDICEEAGRDPSTLVRAVSPSINLLESAKAFTEGVAAYHAAGFRDIYLPWPRTDAEAPVLREVATEIIPYLRGNATTGERDDSGTRSLQNITTEDLPVVSGILADLDNTAAIRFLDHLVDHPDERFDGTALQTLLGVESHAEVTRTVATLGAAFAEHGLARPWSEAQRGYLLSEEMADILSQARARRGNE